MRIRELITPLLIIGLSILFITVSAGVYLTRGNSKFWISKKILFGSLLITLTSLLNPSCNKETEIEPTCYAPPEPNIMSLDNSYDYNNIKINIKETTKLTGKLHNREGQQFTFDITDQSGNDTIQKGNIYPTDGTYDENTEDIYLELSSDLPANSYNLNLYGSPEYSGLRPRFTYLLFVTDEK